MRNLILLFIITLELMPLLPVRQAVEQKTQQQASTLSSNPDEARLITFDIDNFWAAYDKSSSGDKVNVFQQEYFDKGSPGLRAFTQLRIGNARNLRLRHDQGVSPRPPLPRSQDSCQIPSSFRSQNEIPAVPFRGIPKSRMRFPPNCPTFYME